MKETLEASGISVRSGSNVVVVAQLSASCS